MDSEPSDWWRRWGRKLTVGGLITLVCGLVLLGYRSWPVIHAPAQASNALDSVHAVAERVGEVESKLQRTNRSIQIIGCEGIELSEVAAAQLGCTDLSLSRDSPTATRRHVPDGAPWDIFLGKAHADRVHDMTSLPDALLYIRENTSSGDG